MAPAFAYVLLFMMWLCFAGFVWLGALLLSVYAKTKPLSKKVCFAMAGTFPFVIAYQIAAVPVAAFLLVAGWIFWQISEPGHSTVTANPVVSVVTLGLAMASLLIVMGASPMGFYDGWRTGWACASGRPIGDAVLNVPAVKMLRRLLSKVGIQLPKSWLHLYR